ncbi:MAG: OmpH family outer membrane protein [Candidatus Berkiella sp.]
MNNLVKYLSVASLFVAMSLPTQASADGVKIGVVDMRKIVASSPEAKAAMERLQQEFKPKEEKIVKTEKEMKEKSEKLQRNAAVMSDSEKSKLERELVSSQRELQRMQEEFREDSTARYQEEMQKLIEKVNKVVNDIAEKEKYDIILHQDTKLYASAQVDITNKVVKALSN